MSAAAHSLALVPRAPWISAEEVMNRLGWSRRTFFRRRIELTGRMTRQIGPNGKPLMEYLESSLPVAPAPAALQVLPPDSLPLFRGRPNDRIILPDPNDEAKASKRQKLLEPVLDFAKNPYRYASLQLRDERPVTSQERMIEYVAEQSGRSIRTIKRWLANLRTGNRAALANRDRRDKGQSRWFSAHRDAAMLAAYLHLNERQSVTYAYEQIRTMREQLGIEEDNLPSAETVRVFLRDAVPASLRTLARDGEEVYRERFSPYMKRAYTDLYANELWVGDHGKHDVEIQNDLFEEIPYGTPGRLYASTFLDYRSRKAWMTWAWNPNSHSLSATLIRAMVETDEKPGGLQLDNGKDMVKLARGGVRAPAIDPSSDLDPEYEAQRTNWWVDEHEQLQNLGFFTRLGIPVYHCLPRHGQSKHVERFFRTVHLRFDSIHSTYTSGSPFTRPLVTEDLMMRHRRLMKHGRVTESKHPFASRFILGCLSWLEEYNNTPQTGEGMDGLSPNQVYEATRNPKAQKAPDAAGLVELMGQRVKRTVHECAVRINNFRYMPRNDDRAAWVAMHNLDNPEILVAYNPGEPEYAIALTLDGRFIAFLQAELLMPFAPFDKNVQQLVGQGIEIRKGLEKASKETLRTIASEARALGAQSPEEMLYKRLQLPTNTSPVITQPKSRRGRALRPTQPAQQPMTPAQVARQLLDTTEEA